MKKRRLISAVTALAVIITSFVSVVGVAYADETQALPGIFTILDYGSAPLSLTMGAGKDYHVTEAEGKYGISGYQNVDDWTEYDYVNIKLKVTSFTGELEKQGFNMIFGGTTNVSGGRYSRITVYATAEESVFSIPISDLQYGMSLSPTKNHIEYMKFNTGDWSGSLANGVDYNKGSVVSVEKVYLTTAEHGKPLKVVNSNVKDGDGQVSPDLGGSRVIELDFGMELFLKDYQEAVELYEDNGDEFVPSDIGYTISAQGSVLTVKLDGDLKSPMTYKLLIKPNILWSVRGAELSEEYTINFAVGRELDIFKFRASSPDNGSVISAGEDFVCTLEFNTAVDESQLISDYIIVYADGVRVFNAYTAEINGNILNLKFNEPPAKETKYTIRISQNLKNIYGKALSEDSVLTFVTTQSEEETSELYLFSTANSQQVAALGGTRWTIDTGECNYNSSNVKMNLLVGTDVNLFIYSTTGLIYPAGMKYVNMFMYSPAKEDRTMNMIFYTSRANNRYNRYALPIDWEGWKLISIPVSSVYAGEWESLDVITLNFGGWSLPIQTPGYVRVESLWFSKTPPEEPRLLSVNVPENYTEAKLSGEFISFEFADTVTGDSSNITVTDEEGNISNNYTAEFNGAKVNLKFGNLKADTEYKIAISGIMSGQGIRLEAPVEFSFHTASGGVYVSELSISEAEDGYFAEYGIDNLSEEEQTFECVIIAYDVNGGITAQASKALAVAGNSSEKISAELAVPKKAEYIKAYIIDETGRVVSNRYVTLRGTAITDNEAFDIKGTAGISIDKAEIGINLLSVSGTVQGVQNTVVINITAPDGTVIAKEPISAGDDGSFSYNMVLGESSVSGMYTVTASAGEKAQSKTAGYIASSDRAEFFKLADKKDTAKLGAWLEEHKEELGLASKSSAQLKDVAKILAERSYKSYADAHSTVEEIVRLLDGLNDCAWTNMWSFIENNHVILLGEESDDYNYLAQNGGKTVNSIMSEVIKSVPFATVSDFRTKLAREIKDIKASNSKPQTITGAGDSGGGAGGSGSSSIVINSDNTPIKGEPEAKDSFVDLEAYSWASESVYNLVRHGIVAKADDGRFRPGDNILREEFVKMIVEAFCSEIGDDGRRFGDETDGMWYNKYLNTAYANGFVSGYEDGTFGIGECITREDMVTIVCRILEHFGNSLNYSMDAEFADSGDISGYAKDYVAAMSNAKVVSGIGDGRFAPKNNATRAEAAVIIAKVIQLYK